MPDSFFNLTKEDRHDILQTIAEQTGKNAVILEKDIWVVWALNKLFSMPDRLPMAFKGGTSLSKLYAIIKRFSEDIDITIDYNSFNFSYDPLQVEDISNSQIKKISKQLKLSLSEYISQAILPYIQLCYREDFPDELPSIYIEDEEKIYIEYPSMINDSNNYIKNRILLEFGGRNVIFPNEQYNIKTDISNFLDNVTFPVANSVIALSPERTFWEKVTLIHVACNREKVTNNRDHQFRHWYDIAVLYQHNIGKKAIDNHKLLEDVVNHKKIFFNAPYAHYDACLSGNFKLIPNKELIKDLHTDYNLMVDEGMFFENDHSFEEIMSTVKELEDKLNAS